MKLPTTASALTSGYSIANVYILEQSLVPATADALTGASEEGDLTVGWDWRHVQTDVFEVKLELLKAPGRRRPYTAAVTTVGTFQRAGNPSVSLHEFVRVQAVAILLPYGRQFLATLTGNTPPGPVHIPTLNVVAMTQSFDPEKATGFRQERESAPPASGKRKPKR